ncbi:hypothetical protein HUT16_15525 [Kitasatospora sp. NA04385]|uniref:pPIWI_RE_Z domain-containing protein n=1 Tax=Kitasatospora sp. NA04385 TaxID=2742135 RepID=UPI001592A40A|nr:hypothetical protein [Kitasatospora sp. NA04385]QKW20290.1 hypothetical protein HUT16_15525 [Kitasatospora sp. NA04385]
MRDEVSWCKDVVRELTPGWAGLVGAADGTKPVQVCQTELGLRLLERLAPHEAAEGAYTLFGGYPFARAAGLVLTEADETMLDAARYLLWKLRRSHAWRQRLEAYRELPAHVRAYDVPAPGTGQPPRPVLPVVAPGRLRAYDRALSQRPAFVRRPLRLAPAGVNSFRENRRTASVTIPQELVFDRPAGHDLAVGRRGSGRPLVLRRSELLATAQWMDQQEKEAGVGRGYWEQRLAEVRFAPRDPDGQGFGIRDELTLSGMLHLVGMVGAGKSTLMTLVAVWAAQRRPVPLRTTLVVGDVAEQLRLCEVFAGLGLDAVPLLGSSTRETHVQRLHRRLVSRGLDNLLDHDDRAFDDLSTVCVVSGLRGAETETPLRYADAPCVGLVPQTDEANDSDRPADPLAALRRASADAAARPGRATPRGEDEPLGPPRGCPIWAHCPRHGTARRQVETLIWVANPASLVQSPVAAHLNDERLRQAELACLLSDIVFVDEADSVQMRLDQLFAPSATLVQPNLESWLDRLHTHKIEELCRQARLPLTDRQVRQWNTALGGVTVAVDPLCRQLIAEADVQEWVETEYFSPWTLQQKLLDEWFATDGPDPQLPETYLFEGYDDDEDPNGTDPTEPPVDPVRKELTDALDVFRDDPFGEQGPYGTLTDALVDTAGDLLHGLSATRTRQRLDELVGRMLSAVHQGAAVPDRPAEWWDLTSRKVGFVLLLSALHQRLDRLTFLWPQVEAALRLDTQGKELSRRAPLDYAPVVPESPMGNVLGYQYLPDEEERDAVGRFGGTLRFFRSAGVGRELLLRLSEFGADRAADRPGPHVVLMSGTSWAGESTRAHVLTPVGAVLVPSDEATSAVARTRFATRFLYDQAGRPMSLSGTKPKDRLAQARAMAMKLARPALPGTASPLDQELAQIGDDNRRRALLLVGSYREAFAVADAMDAEDRWHGRVRVLVSDDADLAQALHGTGFAEDGGAAAALRRGDLARFAEDPSAEVLVAPLLAVERGHNILNSEHQAAFGTALFLARPHPRPDDLALAIFAINDWTSRFVRDIQRDDKREGPATFSELVARATSLDQAGQAMRHEGRQEWRRLLRRRYVYTYLPPWEKRAFAWDQLVTMWQVIGRLVRGGVPARVVFVDAAFAPRLARSLATAPTDPRAPRVPGRPDGLLQALGSVLQPYFSGAGPEGSAADPADAQLVRLLYQPFYQALCRLDHH